MQRPTVIFKDPGRKLLTGASSFRGVEHGTLGFEAVLEPGVHWLVAPLARIDVQVYDADVRSHEEKSRRVMGTRRVGVRVGQRLAYRQSPV